MFDIINQNMVYEEEWGDDFSSSSEEWQNFEDLEDQFVEVTNPQLLETMLCNDGAPLNAFIDSFHSELLLKPIDTPIKFQEEKIIISTPSIPENNPNERKTFAGKSMKKLFETEERKTTGGKSFNNVGQQKSNEIINRKNTAGKSLKHIQESYKKVKSSQRKNKGKTIIKNEKPSNNQINTNSQLSSEEEIEIVDDPSPNKKRKSMENKTDPKKNKINDLIDVDTPSEMIYDILTNDLDTPHKKATTLEKKLSKVFMGEEILKIMKDDDEDEDIDSI